MKHVRPSISGNPSAGRNVDLAVRAISIAGLAVLVFSAAFLVQGLRGWPDVLSATIVNLAPPLFLGWAAWRFSSRDGPSIWAALILMHFAASLAFAGMWTGSVALLVTLLQPSAANNFYGAAVWHFTGGLTVYGMVAGFARAFKTARRLRERELAATRAEMHALRAQLDPHFLFNTLHTVGALIREDPATAEMAVEQFGDLMRYVLEAGRAELVPLEDELRFVRGYLTLEKLRLGVRLCIDEEIDDESLDCGVPALILQPLVENAIRHGLSRRTEGGRLSIVASLEANVLSLAVTDDGCGLAPEALDRSNGLGLTATRRQLAAHYGESASLSIGAGPGGGVAAEIRLPVSAPRPVAAQ